MRRTYDVSLILPCYNEEQIFFDSIGKIISTLNLSKLQWQIIFVDDKSRDNTAELIRAIVSKNKRCKAVYHRYNMGRGRTVSDGIRASRARVVGYIDIDLEVSPVYIPALVALILGGKTDMIVAKRIYRTTISSIFREILSVGYQVLSDRMVGTGKVDTESGYKFFNRKKILPILKQTRHPHWFWDTEIVVFARRAGLRITQVPVLFVRRFDKTSSVHIFRDTIDYLQSLWELWKRLL